MLKLEEFTAVKLKNEQLFTVAGGTRDTTFTSSDPNHPSGYDDILDNRVSTRYFDGGGHIPYMDRENDGNM